MGELPGKTDPPADWRAESPKAAHSGLVTLKFIELDDPDFEKSNLPNDSLYVFPELTDNGLIIEYRSCH